MGVNTRGKNGLDFGMLNARKWLAVIAGVALATGAAVAHGQAQPKHPVVFDSLQKGEWTVRFRDGSPARKICLRSGEELIQLQHQERNCSRFVVDDAPGLTTVQYTCRGNGYGRTSVRRETATLAQIESQGIAGGLPFHLVAEARRTGSCE